MTTTTGHTDPDLDFVLGRFVDDTDGVRYAQTVSADGMHLASSPGVDAARQDTFAAIASGLASLTDSSVDLFGLGTMHRQIIEATDGWILLSRISVTASLSVVADRNSDLGMIGYEMSRLSKQLGDALSPAVVDRLKGSLRL
ncbi:roadblock/LC7 domain-containing protein [Ilumatobacter sp.]|uniref:roadblock/LC7 domain-containing protein n=1 Tax=Ilumatobacter sp. TaxID=1967498 RepID=UPI003B5234C8